MNESFTFLAESDEMKNFLLFLGFLFFVGLFFASPFIVAGWIAM